MVSRAARRNGALRPAPFGRGHARGGGPSRPARTNPARWAGPIATPRGHQRHWNSERGQHHRHALRGRRPDHLAGISSSSSRPGSTTASSSTAASTTSWPRRGPNSKDTPLTTTARAARTRRYRSRSTTRSPTSTARSAWPGARPELRLGPSSTYATGPSTASTGELRGVRRGRRRPGARQEDSRLPEPTGTSAAAQGPPRRKTSP